MSVASALSIARDLARDAVWHDGECTWIGRCPPSRTGPAGSQALGPDLFVGTAGIAWFLAEAFGATGDEAVRRAAIGAIRHSVHGASFVPPDTRSSLHAGLSGIALAAAIVALRTRDEESAARAREVIDLALSATRGRLDHDLVRGAAGPVVACVALAELLSAPRLLLSATGLAEKILAAAERTDDGISWSSRGRQPYRNLAGMAHGASGIAVALLELFAATREDRYRDAALDAFRYERSVFDPRRRNWPDLSNVRRTGARVRPSFVAFWCHGAPGIALARVRASEILGEGPWQEEARAGLRTTLAALEGDLDRGSIEPALCHGLGGNAAVLLEGFPHLAAAERFAARAAIARAARATLRIVARNPIELPALFTGAAGVGWLNLRLSDARVPSVLLLRREELAPGPAPSASRSRREARRA